MVKKNRRCAGFTVVELMLVVGIVSVLGSVAIPKFLDYMKKSRTTEMIDGLDKIATGAKLYFMTGHFGAAEHNKLKNKGVGWHKGWKWRHNAFPDASDGYTPEMTHAEACDKHAGIFPEATRQEFKQQPWRALLFAPEGKFRYRYMWVPDQNKGVGKKKKPAKAFAYALGDLDCDSTFSQWRTLLIENKDKQLVELGPALTLGPATE